MLERAETSQRFALPGGEVGVNNVWVQKKLQARKKRLKTATNPRYPVHAELTCFVIFRSHYGLGFLNYFVHFLGLERCNVKPKINNF
jgi:hypothetical protein